jgi:hypothetical protein
LFHLGFGLRLVDALQPIRRTRHRTCIKERPWPCFVRGQGRGTRPDPVLGVLDEVRTHGIAFDVAQHGQQMAVVLDGKTFEAPLPDVSAGMVVLMVAANMSGEQPGHVVAELAVGAWPEGEVEVVGHHTKGQQAHRHMFVGVAQQLDEGVEIAILVKDRAAAVTTVEDVITLAAQGNSQCAWHGRYYGTARGKWHGKKYADLLCRKPVRSDRIHAVRAPI